MTAQPDYLDTAVVAEMLGVKRETVWRYAHSGRLPPDARFGRSLVWRPATVAAYLDAMSQRRAHRQAHAAASAPSDGSADRLTGVADRSATGPTSGQEGVPE